MSYYIGPIYPVSFPSHCCKLISKNFLYSKDDKILCCVSILNEVIVQFGGWFAIRSFLEFPNILQVFSPSLHQSTLCLANILWSVRAFWTNHNIEKTLGLAVQVLLDRNSLLGRWYQKPIFIVIIPGILGSPGKTSYPLTDVAELESVDIGRGLMLTAGEVEVAASRLLYRLRLLAEAYKAIFFVHLFFASSYFRYFFKK